MFGVCCLRTASTVCCRERFLGLSVQQKKVLILNLAQEKIFIISKVPTNLDQNGKHNYKKHLVALTVQITLQTD